MRYIIERLIHNYEITGGIAMKHINKITVSIIALGIVAFSISSMAEPAAN